MLVRNHWFTSELEDDCSKNLGITKYEPPIPKFQMVGTKKVKARENPHFRKYGGIDNFKWYPNLFEVGEIVSVTEKIHGSHVRFGYAPFSANTFWKKIKKFFRLAPEYEWVYGSNNVQLQDKIVKSGYYGSDIYGKLLEKCNAKDRVFDGFIVHGELYGDGVQKNYTYGCKNGEHKLIIFDVKDIDENKFLSFREVQEFGKRFGFDVVPEIYNGPYDFEKIKALTLGSSILAPGQKVREGVVIKPVDETLCNKGRKLLKLISEKYLDKEQSDFH